MSLKKLAAPVGTGAAVSEARSCLRIMVFAQKGGMGKSTVASNLLVAAAGDGLRAVGLDFDGQGSLWDWYVQRGQHPLVQRLASLDVGRIALADWTDAFAQSNAHDVAVLDLPPGVDRETAGVVSSLAPRVDLIVIPSLMEEPSYRKVVGFMDAFRAKGLPALFVLNRVEKNQIALREAREALGRHGPVCPVEITKRAEVFRAFEQGLAVVEIDDAPAAVEMRALWKHVRSAAARSPQRAAA
jgi:chromosome partitioning protein